MKTKKQAFPAILERVWSEEERQGFVTELIGNTHFVASKVAGTEDGLAHALMLPRMFITIATSISLGIENLSTKMIIEAFMCLDRDHKRLPKGHIKSAMDAIYSILPAEAKPSKAKREILYKAAELLVKADPPSYISDLPVYKGMSILHKQYLNVVDLTNKKKLSQKKAIDLVGPVMTYLTGLANGLTAGNWRQTIFSVLSASGDGCIRELMKIKDLDKLYSSLTQMINIGSMLASVAGEVGATIHGMVPPANTPGARRETGMNKQPKESLGFQADPSMFK